MPYLIPVGSTIYLGLAILFQVDFGDGGPVWFAFQGPFTWLDIVPGWWPCRTERFHDLFLFLPLPLFWAIMICQRSALQKIEAELGL